MKKNLIKVYIYSTILESLLLFGGVLYYEGDLIAFAGITNPSNNLCVLLFTVFIFILFTGILILTLWSPGLIEKIIQLVQKDRYYYFLSGLIILIIIESFQDILFLYSAEPPRYYGSYIDLLTTIFPLLIWGVWLGMKSLFSIHVLRAREGVGKCVNLKTIGWGFPFGILVGIWGWMIIKGYGYVAGVSEALEYTIGHFRPATSPLPGIHVFLIWGIIVLTFLSIAALCRKLPWLKGISIHQGIPLLVIWTLAFFLWVSVPIDSSYFVDISSFSDYPLIPTSDSFYFEKEAFRLLAGEGFSPTSTHVMYSYFLGFLHLIGGQGYMDILPLHVGVMALTPVFLYKIGSLVHSNLSGFLTSLLFIIRERNQLLVAENISGIGSQDLFSENLALLFVVAFIFLIMRWVLDPENNPYLPPLAGGVMGVAVLIRADLLAMLGFVLLGLLVIFVNKKHLWLKGSVFIIVTVTLVITPWMIRNGYRTGRISLDKAEFISKKITEYTQPDNISGEGDSETMDDRVEIPSSVYLKRDRFYNLTSNALQQSILSLPSNHQPLFTVGSIIEYQSGKISISKHSLFSEDYIFRYVKSLPFFWRTWNRRLPLRSILPVSMVLVLISIGIWSVWKQRGSLTGLPIFAYLGHILIWAFAGYSAGRFIKAVDWIPLLYYSAGIAGITFWGGRCLEQLQILNMSELCRENRGRNPQRNIKRFQKYKNISMTLLFIIVGISIPLSEFIIQPEYTRQNLQNIVEDLEIESLSAEQIDLDENDPDRSILLYGKAVYPRYFPEGEKYLDDRRGRIPDPDKSRVDFYIIGMNNIWVSVPTQVPAQVFPHYSDVIVVGRYVRNLEQDRRKGVKPYFEAQKVFVLNDKSERVEVSEVIQKNP